MAIKNGDEPVAEIAHFWPDFHKRATVLFVVLQLILLGIFLGIIAILDTFEFDALVYCIVIGVFLILNFALHLSVVRLLGRQIKKICDALVYISGENTRASIPSLTERVPLESKSLRTILKFLYRHGDTAVSPTASNEPTAQIASVADSILEKSAASHVALDKAGKIIYASARAPVRPAEDGGQLLDVIFDTQEDSLQAWLTTTENKVRATKTWVRVSDKLAGEPDRRIFDMVASYEKNTGPTQTILLFIDRSEEYLPEEEDLDFIAFAAHELRGPITVIRGYIDVLQDELANTIDDEQSELFKRLEVSANRLSGYINNILNASRYDRRHLRVRLREEKIDEIYEGIADDMQLRASAQHRLLHVEIAKDLPKVAADAASISEVMANLIDNAIKYSNEGGVINITAEVVGDFVQFNVQDFGIGMPANIVSNLFKKFYRSHRSRETVAGSGIGLYISKAFIESHGGSVEVRSVEGEGSTFSFSLPVYETVADKIHDGDNQALIESPSGWIRNHSMYRG